MTDYAYTKTQQKLKEFFGKLKEIGVPDKATNTWLASIGFGSTNHRSFIKILKSLGFISEGDSKPSDLWMKYRGKDDKKILAQAIMNGYAELYSVYPSAHELSDEEIENFFSTKTTAGGQVIEAQVKTFKALCEMADFSNLSEDKDIENELKHETKQNEGQTSPNVEIKTKSSEFSPKLHIDIQIHISPESTPDQIDQIFESMAKHIYKA